VHISEGVLPGWELGAGWLLTACGLYLGLRRLDEELLPFTAFLTSIFFLAGTIHLPFGPASVHLLANGALGIVLGWVSFPAIFIGLLLQALLLQFGGLTVLGVNTFNMALPAVLARHLFLRFKGGTAGVLLAVFVAVAGAGTLTALELTAAGEVFYKVAGFLLLSHVPVLLTESVVTLFFVSFLRRHFKGAGAGLLVTLLLLLLSCPALAHRVSVFADVRGRQVVVDAYFSDGTPVKGGEVKVLDGETGRLLLKGTTDSHGRFTFRLPCPLKLKLVLRAGPLHRAVTQLKLSRPAEGVEEALRRQIEPLQAEIFALRKELSRRRLQDLAGGIGWILGIFGGISLALGRKTER